MLPPSPLSPATSPDTSFTKASIKSRLTRQAAELWGYGEADLDAFDPLVNLLLEACAVEFEKIGQELHGTQSRLIERLATLLNPDVLDLPHPAHAVAQARAREPQVLLPDDAQFVYEPPTVGRQAAGPALYFSPLQPTRLVNGAVQCLATDAAVWQVSPTGQKRLVAQALAPPPAEYRRLWIGLSLPAEAQQLNDLTFYFDWLNEPHRAAYLPFLPGERWRLGETELLPGQGLRTPDPTEAAVLDLDGEYNFLRRIEQQISALYAPLFVQVTGLATALAAYVPRPYPLELAAAFPNPAVELQALTQPLLWVEVRFAHALPPEAFQQITCAINCFPVLNRRLHKVLYRLQPALNLFPLVSEEPFLAVRDVYSLSNVTFRSTTLADGATDTYTLRTHGVGRFDSRTSREALRELLELMRDESQAFTAAGTDFIGGILRELDQSMARLEERLDRQRAAEQPAPFLLLRPKEVRDSVYLEYWSSNGLAANRLPAGSSLRVQDGHYVEEVRLLTTASGGRERPRPEERTNALRRNLLARNRLVTLADIKAACWAELGEYLTAVHVEKGFQMGATPTAGFVRCIRVQLTPAAASRLNPAEWQHAAEALQVVLSGQSALHLPYEVVVQSARQLS